jgi:predicted aconitase with swiveling domain
LNTPISRVNPVHVIVIEKSTCLAGTTRLQGRIFIFFKRRGGKISSGVQVAPLSKIRKGLGVRVKHGGVEHFIRGVREILGA